MQSGRIPIARPTHFGVVDRFRVQPVERVDVGVDIGEGLEVDDEPRSSETPPEVFDAVADLFSNEIRLDRRRCRPG